MMYATFCDSCQKKLIDGAPNTVTVTLKHPYEQFDLCSTCSAGVVEMLKDMRLIKELDTIR